jgi:hypothetical protein
MRATVGTIIERLAAGRSTDEILKAYPFLEAGDILEALAYAAWRAEVVHLFTWPFPSIIGPARRGRWRRGRPAARGGQWRHRTACDPESLVISGFICSRRSR